jgi:hypothetical protein
MQPVSLVAAPLLLLIHFDVVPLRQDLDELEWIVRKVIETARPTLCSFGLMGEGDQQVRAIAVPIKTARGPHLADVRDGSGAESLTRSKSGLHYRR